MKKKLLPLAIAAAMAPGFASAADVSGFADIIYMITDEGGAEDGNGDSETEGKWSASGEVDFSASPADGVMARVDVDLTLNPLTDGDDDSGSIEQAFFSWAATDQVTVIGGVFNNPVGYEAEDAPDMDFTTHGMVYNGLNDATALDGNNVAGVAVTFAAGPANITVGALNDLGQSNNDQMSALLVVNFSPMEGLDLELGMVTADDDLNDDNTIDAGGNITDFNVVFSPEQVAGLTLGLDYATASEQVKSVYDFWVGYDMGNGFGAKARFSSQENDDAGETKDDATTIYLSYQVASNLAAALEFRTDDGDNFAESVNTTQLELIATF